MTKLVLTLLAASLTGGCGVAAKVDARNEYQASLTQYRECLRTQPEKGACDNLRKLVAVNERAYNTMAAGIHRGNYSVGTVTPMED